MQDRPIVDGQTWYFFLPSGGGHGGHESIQGGRCVLFNLDEVVKVDK